MNMTLTKGICPRCHAETGAMTEHDRFCPVPVTAEVDPGLSVRATAHAAAEIALRPAQRFLDGVADTDVALILYLLERGGRLTYNPKTKQWRPPYRRALDGVRPMISIVVNEMLRTGLVRHLRPGQAGNSSHELIPALVHLRDGRSGDWHSACFTPGEDIGPMRTRLVSAEDLAQVDCLACQVVVATGTIRGL